MYYHLCMYSDKSEQICAAINIHQTFEGCRQTFEGKNDIRLCTNMHMYIHIWSSAG